MAGIDPHKHTATITVLDHRGGVLDSRSFTISSDGITELLTFLLDTEVSFDRIGVEGSGFLGRPLVLALSAAGYNVRKVPANRTADRRKRPRRRRVFASRFSARLDTVIRTGKTAREAPGQMVRSRQSPIYQELHPFGITPRRTPDDQLIRQVGKGSLQL